MSSGGGGEEDGEDAVVMRWCASTDQNNTTVSSIFGSTHIYTTLAYYGINPRICHFAKLCHQYFANLGLTL
jgi:hypothetical protein